MVPPKFTALLPGLLRCFLLLHPCSIEDGGYHGIPLMAGPLIYWPLSRGPGNLRSPGFVPPRGTNPGLRRFTVPLVVVQGISAVQGLSHVVGSSTVNWYMILSLAAREKRSTRCNFSLEPRKAVIFVKLVVSTTSVSPSQWPTESPCHWRIFCGRWGLPSVGMTPVGGWVS